jgi:hypothetical protein
MTSKKELWQTFKLCLLVALAIFVVALLSEISVRIAFIAGTDIITGIIADFVGILVLTGILMLLVWDSPKFKKMLSRMFGADEN